MAIPVLAWIGRPADKPIVTGAVVPGAVERLTIEGIVRALGALGIAEMNKALREEPDKAIATVDGPMRDGPGWLARRPAVRRDRRGGQREARGARLRAAPPARLRVARDRPQAAPRRAQPVRRRRGHDQADQPAWPLAKRGAADLFKPRGVRAPTRAAGSVTVTLMFVVGHHRVASRGWARRSCCGCCC